MVGREAELAMLLEATERRGPGVVTLVAAAGMGKSALVGRLARALDGVGARGPAGAPRVLTARPLQSESALAFSGLMDLLRDVPPDAYDALPPPQRSGVRSALLLEEAAHDADPRAVAAGVRSVLTQLALEQPVVLLVDDAHWFDDASAAALGQALHRIGDADVVLVCAARPDHRLASWLPAGDAPQVMTVRLGELAPGELVRIVTDQAGPALSQAELREVARTARGNPLHALELARHRSTEGVGADVQGLVQGRLATLPRETRLALLVAALASDPRLDVLARAHDCEPVELAAVLDPALRSGLVVLSDVVRFTHPLFAEAAVSACSAPDRAAAHLRLADVEPGEEARTRHAGLASEGPDEPLAARLAGTARRMRARGAWDSATDLLALAVERTPGTSPDRPLRAVLLGQWALTGGQPLVAERWLADVRRRHPGTPAYWKATLELARLCQLAARREELHALNQELQDAELDPVLAAEAMVRTVHEELADRPAEQLDAVQAANRVLAQAGPAVDPALLLAGLCLEVQVRTVLGEPTSEPLARAVALDAEHPAVVAVEGPVLQLARAAMMADRFEESRTLCHGLLVRCRDTGDDVSLPVVHSYLGHVEQRAGRWEAAQAVLLEGERVAAGQGHLSLWQMRAQRAAIDGLRGDRDASLAVLAAAAERFAAAEFVVFSAIVAQLAGRVHAAHGAPAAAFTAFGRALDLAAQVGWDDPSDLEADVPYAEAAAALGRYDLAEHRLSSTEARAEQLGQANALAVCLRGRVVLAAARGELDAAAELVPRLLGAYELSPGQPMDRALALLAAGRVHRRVRQKRLAHDCLTAALAIWEELGCAPYLEQAHAELRRVGLRPGRPDALTPTEAQVARLAADGLRNAEIAGAAHLSPKTVEAVLSRSYRKLGIRSRSQLERALRELPPGPAT